MTIAIDDPRAYVNRELSWLSFAGRVIAQVEDPHVPLLERVRFAGICGMLYDEFFMKRMSGLKRQIAKGSTKLSIDGRQPIEEFVACREVVLQQMARIGHAIEDELRPALREAGIPLLDYAELSDAQRRAVRDYLQSSVRAILTPLAVDSEHPFPFVSNLGLNVAIVLEQRKRGGHKLIRIKVPDNRSRWVRVPGSGWVPLEAVIAENVDVVLPNVEPESVHLFRVTRGAHGEHERTFEDEDSLAEPGSIVRQVSRELKARRFAGAVRLQVDSRMPKKLWKWLAKQIGVGQEDVYPTDHYLGLSDLARLDVEGRADLAFPPQEPATHPRLRKLPARDPAAIFREIAKSDFLVHHPYHSFDTSVLRLIQSAAVDPQVLAIKLTIYRTSSDSPIVQALAEAARRGKQVAVLVEITARFDEAPNIAWGQYLEKEGVHVSYGVERLKTHVKLALVVRQEGDQVRLYSHVGTGNYHTGTARIYEDLGVLTANPEICDDAAMVFNALTGATPHGSYRRLLVAPITMRERFTEMIRREADHAHAGRPAAIYAKMSQLQDVDIIRELYRASQAGVKVTLNVRGLCCLRPGVPGLSENIRVYGLVGRYLEHSRLYRFENGGDPAFYLGSADWMRRNLDRRVETIMPILDEGLKRELDRIIDVYEHDNCSAWDCDADGVYVRRTPDGERRRSAQEELAEMASREETPPRIASPSRAPQSPRKRSRRSA